MSWPDHELRVSRAESSPDSLASIMFAVGDETRTLAQILRHASACVEQPGTVLDATTARLVDALLGGGVPAVRAAVTDITWLQYGLALPEGCRVELYRELAGVARAHREGGLVDDFFFMHKPPGLRLRFRVRSAGRAVADQRLGAQLEVWRDTGLITGWGPGVYEPESHLFGGPISMPSVHRLFTADSFAWLDFHAAGGAAGPAWALSLLMIRAFFDAMTIAGWEDIDVWNQLRCQADRWLDDDLLADASPVAATIRRSWQNPDGLLSLLAPAAHSIAEAYEMAIADVCRDWQTEYFTTPGAHIGPREAAAFVIVFHWNRANLSAVRQAVITEALARHDTPTTGV